MDGRLLSRVTRVFTSIQLRCESNFHAKHLKFIPTSTPKPIPTTIPRFGAVSTDHMLEIDYKDGEWQKPVIRPVEPLSIHPTAKVLHYCPTIFEGLKAFRGVDDKIRMFRLERNMARFVRSAKRAALPADFCPIELEKMILKLVSKEKNWVPSGEGNSLYVRPFLMGTDASLGVSTPTEAKLCVVCSPTGPWGSMTLYANPAHIRAAPGGVGSFKMGSNYAPTIYITDQAGALGCDMALWLYGEDQWLTEAGNSNIFVFWKNKSGEVELVTPPLTDGLILPGINRETVIELVKEWGEFKFIERYPTMKEVKEATEDGRMIEMFGVGTAAVVAPVKRIVYVEKDKADPTNIDIPMPEKEKSLTERVRSTINGIQYGKIERSEWVQIVE